jgi:hypothetical protein
LLHHSWIQFDEKNFLSSFKVFINKINSSSNHARPHSTNDFFYSDIHFYRRIHLLPIISLYIDYQHYELYRTLFYNGLRLSYKELPTASRTHDGCLLYHDSDDTSKLRIGFIQCIIKLLDVKQNNAMLFIEQAKITSTADTLNINNIQYKCSNVLQGSLRPTPQFVLIKPEQIKEKLAFRLREISSPKHFFFYRFPNFTEST